TKEEIIYVGDDMRDLQAASGAGLGGFVGVLTGAATRKKFIAAGLSKKNIIKSIRKLPHWLERSGRL
ncbi:MAG: HAD hydrolase-like protein, partial [Candidatus Omnitrophota bacterium]